MVAGVREFLKRRAQNENSLISLKHSVVGLTYAAFGVGILLGCVPKFAERWAPEAADSLTVLALWAGLSLVITSGGYLILAKIFEKRSKS